MGITEEIQNMRNSGQSDSDILQNLRSRGISDIQISQAIEQSKIKEAVSFQDSSDSDLETVGVPAQSSTQQNTVPQTKEEYYPQQDFSNQTYPQQGQMQPYQQDFQYPQYQQTQQSLSSDTISEISEQVLSEKLSPIKNKFEKILDMKNTLDARMDSLNERLLRIENTIDKLQLSLLQKVGEYVNDVSYLKKELVETQKSFKAVHEKKK